MTCRRRWRLSSFEDLREGIVEGAAQRIRPKLMTVLTTVIGLLPVMWSTGTGADVMKRIAAPIIGDRFKGSFCRVEELAKGHGSMLSSCL